MKKMKKAESRFNDPGGNKHYRGEMEKFFLPLLIHDTRYACQQTGSEKLSLLPYFDFTFRKNKPNEKKRKEREQKLIRIFFDLENIAMTPHPRCQRSAYFSRKKKQFSPRSVHEEKQMFEANMLMPHNT